MIISLGGENVYSKTSRRVESRRVLILYDSIGQKSWVGYLHSLFLANLIGHFDQEYEIFPVEQYSIGKINQFDTTFYLGTTYNNPLSQDFIDDVMQTTKNIIWFKYNVWTLANNTNSNFSEQYGFSFLNLDKSGYDEVIYKNTSLKKNALDPELGRVSITNNKLATVLAWAKKSTTANTIPYIVHGANLWYVADIPFTYLSEDDRYLAFADLLYDMLEAKSDNIKRAILRLEDIDPTYNTSTLKATADYLYSQHVPFAMAVIPYYYDPLGYYAGVPRAVKMTDASDFMATLKYMESKGGTIILHGYTHQHQDIPNPYTSVSGHDYEFYTVLQDPVTAEIKLFQPIAEDSYSWVANRVQSALSLLHQAHMKTTIWETPHYAASYLDNQYFAQTFPAVIGRVLYFDNEMMEHSAGQFFPYVIQKDSYGQKIIPENLGCVAPGGGFNSPIRTVEDIIASAKNNLVIREPWASFYYHPYLGITYLQQLIPQIKAMGYEFVPASSDLT